MQRENALSKIFMKIMFSEQLKKQSSIESMLSRDFQTG